MRVKKSFLLVLAVATAFLLAACGKRPVDEEKSPRLVDAAIRSYSEGSEDSQYVQVSLVFDKEISVADTASSLRVTISGERIEEDEMTLRMGDEKDTAELSIPVEAVTSGVLKIQKAEKADTITDIMDADGDYAACDLTLEGIIPSGVTLSTADTGNGKVVKKVESPWNIRSIAWVALTQNGTLVPVSEEREGELLDGHAAVHGHEFLMEDEKDIAAKIADTLERNYSEEYRFSSEGDTVTAQRIDGEGELDIEIYQYLRINGEEIKEEIEEAPDEKEAADEGQGAHADDQEEHTTGPKIKMIETDREITQEEQVFLYALQISHMEPDEKGIIDGTELYTAVTVTGSALPEEQIFSVYDLETLVRDSFMNESLYAFGLPVEKDGHYGMDLPVFLKTCGADTGLEGMQVLFRGQDGTEKICTMEDLRKGQAMLAFGRNEKSPLSLLLFKEAGVEQVDGLALILAGSASDMEDPGYRYHDREPYLDSRDIVFTVETYQKGAEYLGALSTREFTTEELERFMKEEPQAAAGGYYGTLGSTETFRYLGVGGWLDHFEGVDLRWLLREKAGVESLKGSAEFIDRDGEVYARVDDLAYIDDAEKAEDHYVLTTEGVRIPGARPMIACAKNGHPLLPAHDHESEGYIAYGHLNEELEKAGVSVEVGVVKNHSGPFVACLGNQEGYYGGDKAETGGDCIGIRLYLEE